MASTLNLGDWMIIFWDLADRPVTPIYMTPGIFLIHDNEELVEMNEQAYDSEKLLQS